MVLGMLLEGMSIRACYAHNRDEAGTICDLIVTLGEKCDSFLEKNVRNVASKEIQLDEIWDFIGCKAKAFSEEMSHEDWGDSWTWLAVDARKQTDSFP